jgi:flagellar motor switch protein FliN
MTVSQADMDTLAKQSPARAAGSAPSASSAAQQAATQNDESTTSAPAQSPSLTPRPRNIERILHLSIPVSATLAERDMPIGAILALTAGSIIEFDVPFDSDLILSVSNRPIGRGQAVKVGEHFGLRITAIDTIRQRIDAMGGK